MMFAGEWPHGPTEGVILSGTYLSIKWNRRRTGLWRDPFLGRRRGNNKLLLNLSGKRTEKDFKSSIGVFCADAMLIPGCVFCGH